MELKKIVLLLVLLTIFKCADGQQLSNYRIHRLIMPNETQIDTLSIVPNSLQIFDKQGIRVKDSIFTVDCTAAKIWFNSNYTYDTLYIKYQVFPFNFTKKYFRKDSSLLIPQYTDYRKEFRNNYMPTQKNAQFQNTDLIKQGNISRAITIGNNQNASIRSNLNMQLSGQLSDNISIVAAISDDNIPIQPDGTTQQIQEFDKVYIQITAPKTSFIFGDFELQQPKGYFMRFYKKAQGLSVIYNSNNKNLNDTTNLKPTKKLESQVSAAISKGKYNRMQFNGIENNQGPYRLSGAAKENYIIILSATEKVFIDGKQMKRGQDNDYVIDYNTAELSFTSNCPITKDKRIVVEFEYSDRNFARFLVYANSKFEYVNPIKKLHSASWLNIYWEQDSKNQPLKQDLKGSDKYLLHAIGDSLHKAIILNFDTASFSNDRVLYTMKDTLDSGNRFDSIFVHVTDTINVNNKLYSVSFSNVGENKGNYRQIKSTANGRVYRWVAPIDGKLQGNYEPIGILITPKKKQVITIGNELHLSNTTKSWIEIALSQNDLNTFSGMGDKDNTGMALKLEISKRLTKMDTLKLNLISTLNYEFIHKQFDAIDHYKEIEYARNWNLPDNLDISNEHQPTYTTFFTLRKQLFSTYHFDWLQLGAFKGMRNRLITKIEHHGYSISFNGSLLKTNYSDANTNYLRQQSFLQKKIKKTTIGYQIEQEYNVGFKIITDSLLNNSFKYSQHKWYILSSDTLSKLNYSADYVKRYDHIASRNSIVPFTSSDELHCGIQHSKNQSNTIRINAVYRNLSINEKNKPETQKKLKSENSLTGKFEYLFRLFKGNITSTIIYETSSGLEPKREFSYLRVADGQGLFTWNDYNNNGIAELNEFETAFFQDQANYIRIFSPSSEYVKTYWYQANYTLGLKAPNSWRSSKGIKKVTAKFSDQIAYRVNHKGFERKYLQIIEQTTIANDSSLVSMVSNFRNTLSFNQNNPKFGFDILTQNQSAKNILVNGLESQFNSSNTLNIRFRLAKAISAVNQTAISEKRFQSEYFKTKNYDISTVDNTFSINYQPGISLLLKTQYKYSLKKNTDTELLTKDLAVDQHDLGIEIQYKSQKKGDIQLIAKYIRIESDIATNTPLAYIMHEGYKPGNNGTWTLLLQRNLSANLRLSLNYTGRISENSQIVHTGNLELKAAF